ncbi:MAG TPA: NAD-binding protein [Methanospirillum sp.]|nr:NAD-binding protein [Methanospirillum sp.]
MTLRVLIIGGGKVGTYLARLLISEGHFVRIIEGSESEYPRLSKELAKDILIKGNGTDINILKSAEIRDTDVVAAVTRNDEMNLVITSLAKFEFRVPRTIARVNIPKNAWLFTPTMGVDVALNQADLMSHLIAEEMTLGDMKTLLKLRKGQYSLVENTVTSGSIAGDRPIRDLKLPAECVISAIIREGNLIIPRGDTILQVGDEVLAVVHVSELEKLADLMQAQH